MAPSKMENMEQYDGTRDMVERLLYGECRELSYTQYDIDGPAMDEVLATMRLKMVHKNNRRVLFIETEEFGVTRDDVIEDHEKIIIRDDDLLILTERIVGDLNGFTFVEER